MSRVGKNPVVLPDGVQATIKDNTVDIKGKLGQATFVVPDDITVSQNDNALVLTPANKSTEVRTVWGGARANLNNIVVGVSTGYTVNLEILGVGYRAAMQGNTLVMQLGFSHEVRFDVPQGISIKCEKPTSIAVTGTDKQQVGQVAAIIRSYRPPEPYKGKGIRYQGEFVLIKEGKKK